MSKLRLLDLFSGIGGFSLGLERSGFFETVAFCEIEPFPRRVLKKHWPDVPIYEDVRNLTADALRRDGVIDDPAEAEAMADTSSGRRDTSRQELRETTGGWTADWSERSRSIDAICGGFPCQDISVAGKGAGIEGARSGLWAEYARIIGELRPRIVIVENVAALLGRGLQRVLGDLAALGFDAEWHCIPASAVGAPHRRDRLWLCAYSGCEQRIKRSGVGDIAERARQPNRPGNVGSFVAHAADESADRYASRAETEYPV